MKNDNNNTIVIICNQYTLDDLVPMLKYLEYCGDIGHSVSFSVDDKKFFFDGDGADKFFQLIVNGDSEKFNRRSDLASKYYDEIHKNDPKQSNEGCCEFAN